jgi:putative molybdopterin biosynthesis protein
LLEENYFLACLKASLADTAVQRLCAALSGAGWRDILGNLAGYRPAIAPGRVLVMTEALPWWPKIKSKPKAAKRTAALHSS